MPIDSEVVVEDGSGGKVSVIGYVIDQTSGNRYADVLNGNGGTDYIDVNTNGGYVKFTQYSIKWYSNSYPLPLMVYIGNQSVARGGYTFKGWEAVSGGTLGPLDGNNNQNTYIISSLDSPTSNRLVIRPVWRDGSGGGGGSAPSTPTNFRSNNTTQRWVLFSENVTFNWSASDNAINYIISVDGQEKFWVGNTTSYTFAFGKDAIAESAHTVRVKARNSNGDSLYSDAVQVYVRGKVFLRDGMNTSTLYNSGNTWYVTFDPSSFTPTKAGYRFTGWYTAEGSGGTKVTEAFNLKDYNGERTLYAHWETTVAPEYTITFDDNGGTGGPGTRQTTNQKLVIPDRLPTKDGTSGGSSGGSSGFCSKEVAAAILGNFWYEGGMDPTRWEGRWSGNKPNENLGYGLGQWTGAPGRRTNLINHLANNNLPYTNEEGTWINNTGTDYYYRAGKAQVDYLRLENTWYAYVTIYHIPGQNRINSNFNSWQLSSFLSSTSTDVDMLAKEFLYFWECPFYPEQTAEKVQSEETNRITAARRVYEYINEHWNDTSISNANFMTIPNKIGENSSGDKALNDDQRLKNALILARYMVGYNNTPTPGTNGATCLGWSLTKDGPLAYTVGQTVTFDANKRLYAVWASDKTVTYKGTGSDSGLPPAPQSAGYNVTIKISGNTGNLKKTGYEFNTWKKEGGIDIYSFRQNYTGSASLSLVPNWTGKVYKITYSGLGSPIEATVRFGDRFVFPAAPSKQGYDFTGWQLNDTIYQPGDVITSWNIASDVTITATWKKQTFWRMIIPWIYIEE